MKKLFCLSIVLLCSSFAFAQNKPAEITDKKIVELPKAALAKPKLQMQKAMKLMEGFIEKQKIDTSDYFLSQVRLIQYGSENNKKPAWHFWWTKVNGSLGDYIEILVFMDGTAGQIPSM